MPLLASNTVPLVAYARPPLAHVVPCSPTLDCWSPTLGPVSDPTNDPSWLTTPISAPDQVAKYYDDWAQTYDATLKGWHYDSPTIGAQLLVERGGVGPVLDVGCGTGLTGQALHDAGIEIIDGIDLSLASIELARARGVYRHVQHVDLQQLPLPHPTNSYGAMLCIGVLSYVPDAEPLLRETARVVVNGGRVVLSQRDDMWEERNFGELLKRLETEGLFADVWWSEPQPYMPGHEDFTDQIFVHYVTMTVAEISTDWADTTAHLAPS